MKYMNNFYQNKSVEIKFKKVKVLFNWSKGKDDGGGCDFVI